MKKVLAAAAACAALAAIPATASAANPVVDQAVAAYHALGIPELTSMPSGHTAYRTYERVTTPTWTRSPRPIRRSSRSSTAPNRASRAVMIKYMEITNNVDASDGKPVFYLMGAIHGNETAAAEDEHGVRDRHRQPVEGQPRPSRRCSTRSA